MSDQASYRRQVLDHLGLIAGMCNTHGIGAVLDHATQQNPERRDLTVAEEVDAMVLKGWGLINQALSLVPSFFQHKPTSRLMSPRVAPGHLNDDALGRPLDTLYGPGVTELYCFMATTDAQRLGLAPRVAHIERSGVHIDGRDNSDEAPVEQVIHITWGDSREHRPDLNQGMVVADSAIYRGANLQKFAQTPVKCIIHIPSTLSDAQAALAHVDPQTMAALTEHYR